MRRVFAAADVDFDQWRALTIVALKLDFRSTSARRSPFAHGSSAAGALLLQFVFYTLSGIFMAAFAWFCRDLFLIGTVVTTFTMFLIGTAALLDHNSAITSPADYAILGFRPITSRTYLAVRLTNVLVYTIALTTLVAWLPAASLAIRHGPVIGAAGLVVCYASSIGTMLAIMMGYAWMLRTIGPDAIQQALSYAQLVMSFAVYGGYFVASRVIATTVVTSLTLPKTPWLMLYPGTWFATYLELAAGKTGPLEVVPAAASVLVMATLASGLGGRLSLEYSERLGEMTTATALKTATRARAGNGIWWISFTGGEARAIALLVRSQFRNDQKFRLGVLSILPLTIVYVLMSVSDGAVGDPFVRDQGRQSLSLVTMAVMMFPSMLKMHLTCSDGFRASWIFFVSPSRRIEILRAARTVLVAFFLVPYLLFVAALLAWFVPKTLHVVVHVALMGLLSYLLLQVTLFLEPDLPFSRPFQKGRSSAATFTMMGAMTVGSVLLQAFSAELYSSRTATVTAFTLIVLASGIVDRLTQARVERRTEWLEFEG